MITSVLLNYSDVFTVYALLVSVRWRTVALRVIK